jgi:toxin ParE1/3/4
MRPGWTTAALRDVARIHDYIADSNPHAAARVVQALLAAADGLATFPHRGRLVGRNLRELTTIYPYIIRYEISVDEVLILRVRHGMRRP